MVFRTTAQLGPALESKGPYHWDFQPGIDVSYRLGNKETGSDGHEYVMVQAAATHAAGARLDVNETTWVVAANSSGAWQVPAGLTGGVVSGDYFQARKFAI